MSNTDTLLNLSDPTVQRFIGTAKKRGFSTYEDVVALLPGDEFTDEQVDQVIAALAKLGVKVRPPTLAPIELYSLASVQRRREEPSLSSDDAASRRADGQRYVADIEARQGMYLTASGTLTQFNAIMAAIDSAALATAVSRTLSGVLIAALTLHVLAAFILCWAARPVEPAPEMMTAALIADRYTQAAHTFRNYRRGWRFTLIALATTAVAAGVFVLGIEVPHLLAPSS